MSTPLVHPMAQWWRDRFDDIAEDAATLLASNAPDHLHPGILGIKEVATQMRDSMDAAINAPSLTPVSESEAIIPKHQQDAPRVKRNTFKVPNPHSNVKPKEIEVVFSSFAACIEREANQLRTFAPSAGATIKVWATCPDCGCGNRLNGQLIHAPECSRPEEPTIEDALEDALWALHSYESSRDDAGRVYSEKDIADMVAAVRAPRSAKAPLCDAMGINDDALNEAGWELLRVVDTIHANDCKRVARCVLVAYINSLQRQRK
jgi:hypothetical protein